MGCAWLSLVIKFSPKENATPTCIFYVLQVCNIANFMLKGSIDNNMLSIKFAILHMHL